MWLDCDNVYVLRTPKTFCHGEWHVVGSWCVFTNTLLQKIFIEIHSLDSKRGSVPKSVWDAAEVFYLHILCRDDIYLSYIITFEIRSFNFLLEGWNKI